MSADTFEFDDRNHAERFVGTLHDPAATPGDVLTVQADGSVAAKPGGGSMPFAAVTVSGPAVTSGETIPFDTVVADADGFFDAINTQFVVPVGKGGVYLTGLWLEIGNPNMGNVEAAVNTSGPGSNIGFGLVLAEASYWSAAGSAPMVLNDGDAVTAVVFWDGVAADANITLGELWLMRLGDS